MNDDERLLGLAVRGDQTATNRLIRAATRRHDLSLLSRLHDALSRRGHEPPLRLVVDALLELGAWSISTCATSELGQVRYRMTDAWAITPRGAAVFDGAGGHGTGVFPSGAAAHMFARCFDPSGQASRVSMNDTIAMRFGDRLRTLRPVQALSKTLPAPGEQLAMLLEVMKETIRDFLARDALPGGAVRGAGASCACLHVDHGLVNIAHVGSCRVYRLRDGVLTQLTRDHSLPNDALAQGTLTPEDALSFPFRGIQIRNLVGAPELEVDVHGFPPQPGDRYLLTTDGLHDTIPHARLERLAREPHDAASACEALLDVTRDLDAQDIATVAVVDVGRSSG